MFDNKAGKQKVPDIAGFPVATQVETLRCRTGNAADWGSRAASALATVGELWQARLNNGWEPPRTESPFPWAQVRLSLAALVPGLCAAEEWRARAEQAPGKLDPPPVVALVLAGNSPLMAWSPLCACLLAGCSVYVKMSRDETLWPRLFCELLAQADPEIAARVVREVWRGADPRTSELVQAVDAVVAFGSDATLDALRAATPAITPFFGYGHAISVGWLSESGTLSDLNGFANDALMFGQGGCLSPHTVFYDRAAWGNAVALGVELSSALREESDRLKVPPVFDPAIAAAVREARDIALFEGLDLRPFDDDLTDLRWTAIFNYPPSEFTALPPPVGHGIVCLLPVTLDALRDLPRLFGAYRGRVSCAGIAGKVTPELRAALEAEGVSRICKPGEMQTPPLDWPNGGFDLLTALLSARLGH